MIQLLVSWCIVCCLLLRPCSTSEVGQYGGDSFAYPKWILEQWQHCNCSSDLRCSSSLKVKNYSHRNSQHLTNPKAELDFCESKEWLLQHMPQFDLVFLPPSATVQGGSMLDDNIAFSMMVETASPSFSKLIPLWLRLHYILPYASYHEPRVNWRPWLASRFADLVKDAKSTDEAVGRLIAPNIFTQLSSVETVVWKSSTAPPVISPFGFAALGYGSCTAWSTLLTYTLRSVGVPARQTGTPCWNGGEFAGLAVDNPKVVKCWEGGAWESDGPGGKYLFNHNWVEFWSTETNSWSFVNVPPQSKKPNEGLCDFSEKHGCGWSSSSNSCSHAWTSGGPGAASLDHPIISATWTFPGEEHSAFYDGGEIIDARDWKLSSGEEVSPLVWSPFLRNALGQPLKDFGLRFVNRTQVYRCHE